ncbi:IclR family transcriptional regulator [Kineococcus gynurae]|uniref:IclR family transcriptional regulator n=1 Tax=Kineococcus gynurae TaxID=452979 RepID=A0ABV5LS33_9ACTN
MSDGVQSVDRALTLLQILSRHGSLGVTEIARAAGVHKSTAFRLLSTLEARGFVAQRDDRGQYRLGPAAAELSVGATVSHDLSAGHGICVDLAATVGETVALVVSDGRETTTVDEVVGEAKLSSFDSIGSRAPLHATAAGKVFLAALSPEDLRATLSTPLVAYTPRTICDPAVLGEQLVEVRDRGYAVVQEEFEVGLVALAAPVHGTDGQLAAAMTVAGPAYRVGPHRFEELAQHLLTAADALSWRLGHVKRG